MMDNVGLRACAHLVAICSLLIGQRVGAAVHVQEAETTVTIATDRYEVVLAKDKGWTIGTLRPADAKRPMAVQRAGLAVVEERERPEWKDAFFGSPTQHLESSAEVDGGVEYTEDAATCTSTWRNAAAEVRRTTVFRAGTPAVDVSYRIRVLRPLEQIGYFLDVNDTKLSREGRFHPGAKRYQARMPVEASFVPAPAHVLCSDGGTGIGLVAPDTAKGVATLAFTTYAPSWRRTHLAAYSPMLRWRELPYDLEMTFSVVVGATPAEAEALFRERSRQLKPVQIAELRVEKLIHRRAEPGRARVVLRNHTNAPRTVALQPSVCGGVADRRALPAQSVVVPGLSDLPVPIGWKNDAEYGFELLTEVRSTEGKVLDTARAWFAVADHFPKVAQTTVWNAGWMRYDWLTPAMVQKAKECCVGLIEYYCWAPDQVFDLTPDTETWEPHTESQGAYRTELTRGFLRGLVDTAHASGLRVVAMDTGFASLHGALSNPERIKYTADGQMYLYNGNIHDGRRFNAVGAHLFKPEYTKAWAEEMCASVDMFGWDGVRFDWNFIPIAPQDPLHMEAKKKDENPYIAAKRQAWYTWDGRSAHDLFPDPDSTAAELCKVYRETVAARHPRFIYSVNYSVNLGPFERYPKYSQQNCRDAGVLMESLLNVAHTYPTWQAWAGVLTDCLRIVRPLRAQPFVGWMRGYAPGGIAHRNIQFIMMASGFRWYGSYGARHSLDDTHARFRHATRFAEFFYDPAFVPQDAETRGVSLRADGADRVLWRPFVFERSQPDGRDLVVHLINLPKDDPIIMHHEQPPPRGNLALGISLPDGYKPEEAWLLVPDPHPHAERLDTSSGGAAEAVVEIPELVSMGTVVLRLRGEE